MIALSLRAGAADRALRQAAGLVGQAEAVAQAFADPAVIDLPPQPTADAAQLRAIASLYLAASLEAAGLIAAAEDLTRLARSGALRGDFGGAAPLIEAFWQDRDERASEEERLALFRRLFGIPPGPADATWRINDGFEEELLGLCEEIISSADTGGVEGTQLRAAARRLAANLADAAGDMTLFLAREVLDSLGRALAILNHPAVRPVLASRTLWESIGAIDRLMRRPPRATLTHLRRGRAGMTVIAWLANVAETLSAVGRLAVAADDPVVDAAVDWLDETLELMNDASPAPVPTRSAREDWASLAA